MTNGSLLTPVRAAYGNWLGAMSTLFTPPPKRQPWGLLIIHDSGRLQIFSPGKEPRLLAAIDSDGDPEGTADVQRVRLPNAARTARPRDIVLRLSPGDVLERTVQLPKAARDVIEPVIENQLERLVPWPREATCYGYQVLGTNVQVPEQLDVHVVATPRYVVEAALERLRRPGLSPYLVDYATDPYAPIGIPLLSLAPDPRKRTAALLHGACMILLGLALTASASGAYLAWDSRVKLKSIEADISERRTQLAAITSQGQIAEAQKQHGRKLARRRIDEPAAVILVEALSRAIPSTSYLTDLEVRGGEIRITGKSPDPTQLIALIENSEQFDNVAFSAPTTREQTGGLRTFSITARTRPDALQGR